LEYLSAFILHPMNFWMDKMRKQNGLLCLLSSFIKDETGGEVLEYALIAGLIVVAAIGVIGKVGGKVLARWNSLNSSL
jgi:Flp pilus assembly pilin Flp